MANEYLENFRKQYPMYNELDDTTLAKNIHTTFYKDMPENEYMAKLGLVNPISDEKQKETISQYKTTTPENWGDKISKDWESLKNNFGITEDQPLDTAITNAQDNKSESTNSDIINKILTPKQDVEVATIKDNSNLVDQVQSSFLQQSRESARAIAKNVKQGLGQTSGLRDTAEYVNVPESINQKEADKIVGYSTQDRNSDTKNMQEIRASFDDGHYGTAFVNTIKELPSILSDSSGEMFQFLNLPSTAVAIQARVSKFEDEYMQNNGGKKPADQSWYDTAFLSQAALILGERFGIKKIGEIALRKTPKSISTPTAIIGAGAYESGQEGGEYVSEEYLTQKDGNKTLGEIATTPDAKFSAFMGGAVGTTLGAGAKGIEKVSEYIDPSEETKANRVATTLDNNINETSLEQNILNEINPKQAYYQEATNNINNKLDSVLKGFSNLQEEIKTNNEMPIEELLQKDLKVKVDENIKPLDNNIPAIETAQTDNNALPIPAVEETTNTNLINENENAVIPTKTVEKNSDITTPQIIEGNENIFKPFEYTQDNGEKHINITGIKPNEVKAFYDSYAQDEVEFKIGNMTLFGKPLPGDYQNVPEGYVTVYTKQGLLENVKDSEITNINSKENSVPQIDENIQNNTKIDESNWHNIPDDMNVNISQGSNRANELTVKDLNKNDDPYIYQTGEIQSDNGVSTTINRKLASEDELIQKNKNKLVDDKYQHFFEDGEINEDGFLKTKKMSAETYKEFNDYLKANNIGEYINKRTSKDGKIGFKINNPDVLNTFGPAPVVENIESKVTEKGIKIKEELLSNNKSSDNLEIQAKTINLYEDDSLDLQASNIKDYEKGKKVIVDYQGKKQVATISQKQDNYSKNHIGVDFLDGGSVGVHVNKLSSPTDMEANNYVGKIGTFNINPIFRDAVFKQLMLHNKELGFKGVALKQESEAMLNQIEFDEVTGLAKGLLIDKVKESLIDKVFNETATNEDINKLDTLIEEDNKNESNSKTTENSSIQDIQTVEGQGSNTQSNNDTIETNVPRVETTNQKPIVFNIDKTYSTKGINEEYPNKTIAKRVQKDVAKYVEQLASKLGYEFDTDKNGKKKVFNGVNANIPPAGGNVSFYLWKPNSNHGVYISLPYQPDYLDNGYENYKLQDLIAGGSKEYLYRVETKDGKSLNNRRVNRDNLTSESFVEDIISAVNRADEKQNNDIIKEDKKEVIENANNINNTAENRATGDIQGNVPDSIRGNEPTGIQSTAKSEQVIEASNQDIAANDGGLNTANEPGANDTRSKGNSNTQLHSRNVTDDIFTLNQERIYDSGEVSRYISNVNAIKLIKENKTHYTDEEKQIISSYTGFGGLQKAFKNSKDEWNEGWEERGNQLKQLLTNDEYKAIERGILDAFYTPLPTVKTMWDISAQLGFKGGIVLEPSMGTGRFVGMTPTTLKNRTSFNGIEIDPITYKVATVLYSKVNARNKGFEDTNYDSNHDMVIGNPPYGEFKLYDKNNKEYNTLSAHNYFVVKSLDALKEGGVLNFVISASFLDNLDSKTISLINSKAKFIGAIRLPSDVFKGAGTNVTTDIVLFQKLRSGEDGNSNVWGNKSELNGFKLNQYFIDNPAMMLGDWVKGFRNNGKLVKDDSFEDNLQAAIAKLPSDIMSYENNITQKDIEKLSDSNIPASIIYVKDGKVFVNVQEKGISTPEQIKIAPDKAKDFLKIKESLKNVIDKQLDENIEDSILEAERKTLNNSYESFVKKHGPLNKSTNRGFIVKDRDGYLILTLEENYKQEIKPDNKRGLKPRKESFTKADILTKRTITPQKEIKTSDTNEALLFSLNTKGNVDLDYISKITSKDTNKILDELKGKIFYDNDLGYVTRDVFLSGDVKTKYANTIDEYAKEELKKVLPKDLEAKDIKTEFGQKWIDKKYFEKFLVEKVGYSRLSLAQSEITSQWYFDGISYSFPYRASRVDDKKIVESALNNKQIKVTYKGADDKTYINQEATDFANTQVDKLKEDFEDWIFRDTARREELVKKYNEVKNRYVQIDTKDLLENYSIPNLSYFVPRLHQKKAVYKAVFGNSPLLLNHTVGSGKTLTSQMIAMEWRRLGKAKKPLIATLKSVVPQYAKEFKEAYPNAKILVPTDADFTTANRKRLLSSIATGDYDAIIITHDQLKMIENPSELQNQMIETEINDVIDAIQELDRVNDGDSKRTKRDLLKKQEALENRYKQLEDTKKDEHILSFDKLGIDGLIIDESHKFKKLAYNSSLGQIKGMPDQKGSKLAFDLYVKTKHILNTSSSKNVIFMTGTPITNTIPELYLIQKFLQPEILQEQGISNFDSYAKDYVEQTTEVEITPTGGFKEITRIKNFKNLTSLMQTTSQIIDTVTNEDIKKSSKSFKLPPLKDGKPTLIFLEPNEAQIAFNEKLIERVKSITKDSKDNHLVIFGDAGKMSVDMRLLSDEYKDEKISKLNEVVNQAVKKYKEFDSVKGTQLIFSDIGTPKGGENSRLKIEALIKKSEDGDTEATKQLEKYSEAELDDILNGGEFSVYEDIKKKLIKNGVPANEVVFIHDFDTKEKKIELNEEVRAGKIRFVIGSTQKLGTGINVQERLVAVHHIDIPYTPAELEQRNGRIIRQGNKLIDEIKDFKIEIFYYATKRTLDGMKWQILENKAKFIQQFFDGVNDENIEVEEMSNSELAERMKAEASGNPLLIDKIKLEKQIKKLRNLKRGAELAKAEKADRLIALDSIIKNHEKSIEQYTKDAATVNDNVLMINGKHYEKTGELGEAVYDVVANIVNKGIKTTQVLGDIGDIELSVDYDKYTDNVSINFTGAALTKLVYQFTNQPTVGLGQKINHKIKDYEKALNIFESSLTKLKAEKEDLKNGTEKGFEKENELNELVAEHSNIIRTIANEATPNKNTNEKNDTSYMKSSDTAMPNNPERLTGKESIRLDDKMTVRGNEIALPDKFNPMTPAAIRKQVISIIGNRLYFSKIKQKAEGFYRKKTGETRIKDINSVEVYAHEIAHYLDFYNGNKVFKNAYTNTNFKDEVESFSYTENEDQRSFEGFAEYVRAYLTQYVFAKQNAPLFTEEFERILKSTKLDNSIHKLQEDMHKFYYQGDEAIFSSLIGDKKSKLDALKETIFNIKHSLANKTLINFFDRTHGFSVAEFTMFNKLQKAEDSPTKLLRLALGGSASTYESVIKYGTPTLTAKGDLAFNGKGLADIFEPVLKEGSNEFKELMEYFAAVQANEMMEQNKKTPFSKSQIETILKRGDIKPLYKRVFQEYQDFNNRMLDFYVQMDYLTPTDVENFRNKNTVYVPMQRVVESMGQKDGNSGGFFGRKGSDRNIRDIEKNITEQLFYHIRGAMLSHAKSKLFNQLTQHEDGSLFAVRLAPDTKKVKVNIEQQAKHMVDYLYQAGMMVDENGDIVELDQNISLNEVIDNTIDTLITKPYLMNFMSFGHKPKNTGSNIEEVIINGSKKYFEIQTGELGDILNTTLNNLGGVQYGWLLGTLYAFKNFKTRAITAMPQFKLPNMVRDTLDAQVFRKTKSIVNPFAGAKSYLTIDDAYKNYMLNGGGYGTLLESTTNAKPDAIFKESTWQKFDRFMSFDEYSNRVSVAEAVIEEGGSWFDAAYQGRDLTVDFSMVGANPVLRHFLKLMPFQQAGMNGMYKLIREIKDEGHNASTYGKAVLKLSMKGLTYLTPMAMIAFMMSQDDERYKALTSDELSRFLWFFYDKNEQPIKIPVPFGLGAIFQKFPEYIMSALFSNGDYVDNRYQDAVMFAITHQMIPVPNGGIFDPFIQDMMNKKFTGAPIVSSQLQKVEPYLQYNNLTPEIYKQLGHATGLSPLKIEHYTKGTLGYLENAITGMTQIALWDKDKFGEMPYSSTEDYVHGTFFKQFYKMNDTSRTAWSEEYYKYRDKIDTAYNSVKFTNKQIVKDRGDTYEEYLGQKDKVLLSSLKKFTSNLDAITLNLKKAEDAIVFDKKLSSVDKEKKLEDMYKQQNIMFKQVYKEINKVIEEGK